MYCLVMVFMVFECVLCVVTEQELRGNVRVFARLRPFLPNDKKREDENPVITVGVDGLSMTIKDPSGDD